MGASLSSDGERESPSLSSVRKKGVTKRLPKGSKTEELLHKIPGRVSGNGSTSSASLFSQQGKKGINQDAMIVWENFGSRSNTTFCGVFDGHGPFGHIVARRVRDILPLKLSTQMEMNFARNDEGFVTVIQDDDDPIRKDLKFDVLHRMKDSFLKAFRFMDKELRVHAGVDCFCSGTTAVALIKQGRDLIIGNVGDSRAILATRAQDNRLLAVQLTVDLKPDLPREAERIKRCKGRVFSLTEEPGVARVWLPHLNSPGLAMARAFGDFCLKDFGLISVPDLIFRQISDRDEFIVLATDGVWDVLTNKEVVDVVAGAPSKELAAKTLVEAAARAWRARYPTSKMDDCAAVCLFLDSEPCNGKAAEIAEDEGVDRSTLEGVSRVDTLLTVPRFLPKDG